MDRRRRIGAYGLCRDGARVLLTRTAPTSPFPGYWQLPGAAVAHGEHPTDALLRGFREETGLTVEAVGLRAAVADVARLAGPAGPVAEHTDRIIYDVVTTGGALHPDPDGDGRAAAWLTPVEVAELPLMPFTAELLGRPVRALPTGNPPPVRDAGPSADRRQRFAAYGLVTDPDRRILLTLIADGYPGAGCWHLPGGGTDHGEQPATALLRELVEETGQLGRVTDLLHVSHRHSPAEYGPEGRPLDWHGVRVIYRVVVEAPTEARVTEAGGSTTDARWFTLAEAAALPRTQVVDTALALAGDITG